MYAARVEGKNPMHATPEDGRLTYDDFLRFPEDGKRHEIIDGVHFVSPSPTTRHQVLVGRLYFAIESFLRQRPRIGRVFLSRLDVVLTRWDVVEPDLLFVADDQAEIVGEQNVQGAPALVIEVLSPGTRSVDRQLKHRLFQREGVQEYWLVDPEFELVTVFGENTDGAFARRAEFTSAAHDMLTTSLMTGMAIPLDDLFA